MDNSKNSFTEIIESSTASNDQQGGEYKLVVVDPEPAFSLVALIHEVRNPITNISLAIEMLYRLANNDNQKLYIDIVKRASIRINSLINELSRQQQAEAIKAEELSMHDLLDEVLALAEDRIMLNNITIRKDYCSRDYKGVTNREKMKIALTNIVINALDSMAPTNGELGIITTSINGHFSIRIEDNGCGISKEDLKHIFKPFFTNKPEGLGIGLATTHDILKANNVQITVNSEIGRGTSFKLSFAPHSPSV